MTQIKRSFLFIIAITLSVGGIGISSPAYCATPPIPKSKSNAIGYYDEQLKSQKAEKSVLKKQKKALEGQLSRTKKRLISVAKSVQSSEANLQHLEERIIQLEIQKKNIETVLGSDREKIAHLILALERIKRVPPEALIARPGAPLKTAQSAMLMSNIIPILDKHAQELKENLNNLDQISEALLRDKQQAIASNDKLKSEHLKIRTLIKKRESLYAQTDKNLKTREIEVKRISRQAKNLHDLVERLEKERHAKREAERKAATKKPIRTASSMMLPKMGQAQLPVSGVIRTSYGEEDTFGAPSKGTTIEGRKGALVVAPMGGIVRFTGPFKRYGNLIILEHKNGYHSLIAGFEKIDTVVGQSVNAGEPLGSLSQSASSRSSLYYELRHEGQPINPSIKFADLS